MQHRNWFFEPLRMFGYDLIVIDNPTVFETYSDKGASKSGAAHYDVMSWRALSEMPVGHLARANGVVAMWATPPNLKLSLDLMEKWGALFKTELVWNKVTAAGKRRMGTGYRARGYHESILIGVFGDEYQYHDAFTGAFDGVAREHSRKPVEAYEMLRAATPGAFRCDIFSREIHEGFDGWGNESGKFNLVDAPRKAVKPVEIAPAPLFDMLGAAA